MPEPFCLAAGLGLLKAGTAISAKSAAAAGAKAGTAKVAAASAKATANAASSVATYGTGQIGATATSVILGTCVATTTMLGIVGCLALAVEGHHMAESSARRSCETIERRSEQE